MVPNIEQDYILLLGIVLYTKNITLLGSTTKKNTTQVLQCQVDSLHRQNSACKWVQGQQLQRLDCWFRV